jgi:Domain of unknown function (DUF4145)
MAPGDWQCPFCGLKTVLPSDRIQETLASPPVECAQGPCTFRLVLMVCPNHECRAMSASMAVYAYEDDGRGLRRIASAPSQTWKVIPTSNAKQFPDYVPEKIVKEYSDACAVLEINTHAAATLARRCLQAILRDFFAVKKNTLADEFEAVKEKLDAETWSAIDVVRKTGNVGKNMEKGVNLVFDADLGEAQLLIGLIEVLVEECYMARQARKQRLEGMRGRVSLKPGA